MIYCKIYQNTMNLSKSRYTIIQHFQYFGFHYWKNKDNNRQKIAFNLFPIVKLNTHLYLSYHRKNDSTTWNCLTIIYTCGFIGFADPNKHNNFSKTWSRKPRVVCLMLLFNNIGNKEVSWTYKSNKRKKQF